jgi:glyoxylate/hydroxypyruvate reductase A
MSILVAVQGYKAESFCDALERLMPGREIVRHGDPFDRRAVDYVVAWKHPPGALAGLPNLSAVFSLGAGVDHLMGDPRLPDVPILRVVDPDLTARMSEYVVLHCLKILRQQMRYVTQQAERRWEDDLGQPPAARARVGLMGLGVLGQDAGFKLRMIGFDVAGWSRRPKTVEGIATYAGADQLPAFLARTDILVVLLPLTPDTRNMIDASVLRGLARDGRVGGAHLINAGRGGLQVEEDILACLDDGTLASATLDVFQTEPLPEDSPFWSHPRVSITPHNAAMSEPDAIIGLIARQIERHEAGEPWENVVNPETGY